MKEDSNKFIFLLRAEGKKKYLCYPCLFFLLGVISFIFLTSLKCIYKSSANTIYYVSQDGDDKNPGTISLPFKSLAKAFKIVDSSNKVDHNPITIFIRGGIYTLTSGLKLSGIRNEVTIESYNNEDVVFTGGRTLQSSNFKLVKDAVVLNRLPEKARLNVYEVNLRDLGIADYGIRRSITHNATKFVSPLELYSNGRPMPIARWPNGNQLLKIKQVLQQDNKVKKDFATFSYSSPSKRYWATKDIWIAGKLSQGWSYDNLPTALVNNTTGEVRLANYSSYGIYSNSDISSGTIQAAKSQRGFYFYNILEELDEPGEWFLDKQSGILYYWPLDGVISKNIIELSLLNDPMLFLQNCSNITIRNIHFTIGRGRGIQLVNCKDILLDKCKVENLGLYGITTFQCNGIAINSCIINNIGGEGIILDGGNRKTLEGGNNKVSLCDFSNFSRIYKIYSPAVLMRGVGNIVDKNYIHSSSGQAIVFSGNEHIIQNNIVENVCTEFSDIGAIYTVFDLSSTGTVIRNNMFKNIVGDKLVAAVYFDEGASGFKVLNNLFYNCGSKQNDGFGAIHINGGGANIFNNNIFVNCAKAFSDNSWSDDKWRKSFGEKSKISRMLNDSINIESAVYTKKYPWLLKSNDLNKPFARVNSVNNTVAFNLNILLSGKDFNVVNSFKSNQALSQQNLASIELLLPSYVKRWKGRETFSFVNLYKN